LVYNSDTNIWTHGKSLSGGYTVSGSLNITGSLIINGTSYSAATSGTSGIAGTSGTTGTAGTAGSAGTSGAAGAPGTSGTSGERGTSGTTGTAGTAGSAGTSGVAGQAGTAGTAGSAGTSGLAGAPGTSGTSGAAGGPGTSGTSGASGGPGTSGVSGTAGTSGASNGTTYTVTLADVENTTTETTVAQFTVPANTWSDGQIVELRIATVALQNSGAGNNWVGKIGGTGITERSSQTVSIANALFQYRNISVFRFYREGSAVTFNVLSPQSAIGVYSDSTRYPFDNQGAMVGPINLIDLDASVDFTTNITITYKMQWGTANASSWVRTISGRAIKYDGGNV
jgi:hypothetical protein